VAAVVEEGVEALKESGREEEGEKYDI